jgi:hypothetical protein
MPGLGSHITADHVQKQLVLGRSQLGALNAWFIVTHRPLPPQWLMYYWRVGIP